VQQVSYAFRFPADQSHARFLAHGSERSSSDRRDFTDSDLAAGRIEEGLDVLEAAVRGGAFRCRLVHRRFRFTAGLGRQRTRDLRGLLQLIGKIPRQQLLDAIDRMVGDALEDIVQVALRIDVV